MVLRSNRKRAKPDRLQVFGLRDREDAINKLREQRNREREGLKNWGDIWMVPAYISGAVLLFLVIFFKEKNK